MEQHIGIVSLTDQGKLPEWIRLLPLGEVSLADGREPFTVDRTAAEAIVQGFRGRGIDLVIDYEHQSLGGERAPAAGWIKELQSRADGLWGRVEWTLQGAEYLTNREYRYFSPVLRMDPVTRRPTALMHVGLTNVPAMNSLAPLVAKAGKGLAGEDARPTKEAKAMIEKLKNLLGITGEQGEGEILALAEQRFKMADAAIGSLPEIALAAGLEETATPAQVKGAVLALKQGQTELESFRFRVETLEAERCQEKAQAAVDEALQAGKLIPAESALALKDAARDLEGFRERMAVRPKLVPVGEEFRMPKGGGKSSDLPADAPTDQILAFKAQQLAKEKGLDLAEAQRQVMHDNPEMAQKWHGAATVGL